MLQNNDTFELKYLTGKVLEYDTKTRFVKVFIPKLTPSLYQNEIKEYETLVNTSNMNIKNSLSVDAIIKHSNVLICRPYDYTQKMPDIGSYIEVITFDDDISKLLWRHPIAVNNNYYSVIADEKYDTLVTVTVNNIDYEIKSEDHINIEVPDSFKLTLINENKTKTFRLSENIGTDMNSLKNKLSELNDNMNTAVMIYKESLIDLLQCNIFDNIAEKYNEIITNKLESCNNFTELYSAKNIITKFNKSLNTIKSNIDKLTNAGKTDIVNTINSELLNINTAPFSSYTYIIDGMLATSSITRYIRLHCTAKINNEFVINPNIEAKLDDNILNIINNSNYTFAYEDNHEYSSNQVYSENGIFTNWYTQTGTLITDTDTIVDNIDIYPAYLQLVGTYFNDTNDNNKIKMKFTVEHSIISDSGKIMLDTQNISIIVKIGNTTQIYMTPIEITGDKIVATIVYNNNTISLTL